MKKIALFFGAGAEISYGLPSGGQFALDIIRMDTSEDKIKFKEELAKINTGTVYSSWLPNNFTEKKVTAFTKGQYEALVKGSLENKREVIIDYLNNFDNNVSKITNRFKSANISIVTTLEELTGDDFGNLNYSQKIRLNKLLGNEFTDINSIFKSQYFSFILRLLEIEEVSFDFKKNIRIIIRSILELLIGSLGEELIHKLNDGIFEKSPDTIDIFDDLGAIFTLNYKDTGMRGLELIIESENKDISSIKGNENILFEFGKQILEDIFSRALDYQALLDLNWRYIYSPKTDWAKFSKIVIFLKTVRRYIMSVAEKNKDKILNNPGYYHDIKSLKSKYEIQAIGTSNYNLFIQEITDDEIFFLNGSISDFYDPYLNKIVDESYNNERNHIIVPFLFTQSGIKPLTSVKMSERYVNIYKKFKDSDVICVVGFGFNSDDGHINGMFRALIEDDNKKVIILHYDPKGKDDLTTIKLTYKNKLRLESNKGLEIIVVNDERKTTIENEYWYDKM